MIALLSIVALALTTQTWANGYQFGIDISWNGLGMRTGGQYAHDGSAEAVAAQSVTPLGIWVVLACAITLLTAVIMAIPRLAGFAMWLRWAGGLVALVAITVPAVILIEPISFLSMFDYMTPEAVAHYRGYMRDLVLHRPTLIALIVVLFLTSAACVAAAVHVKRVPTVASTDPQESETPRSERSD